MDYYLYEFDVMPYNSGILIEFIYTKIEFNPWVSDFIYTDVDVGG